MATTVITSQTIGGIPDQRITIGTGYVARPHGVPSASWTKLRLGIRFQWHNTGANLTSTPRFFCGLCSGVAAPVGTGAPLHALGVWSNSATWTYAAAAGSNMTYYSTPNTGLLGAHFVNSPTPTTGGAFGATVYCPADQTAATRRMLFVDITKGSPNYTIGWFMANTAVAAPDVLVADFLGVMELSTPSFTGHGVASSPYAVATNETTQGVLDCVNVAWDRTTPTMDICDIAVMKLA